MVTSGSYGHKFDDVTWSWMVKDMTLICFGPINSITAGNTGLVPKYHQYHQLSWLSPDIFTGRCTYVKGTIWNGLRRIKWTCARWRHHKVLDYIITHYFQKRQSCLENRINIKYNTKSCSLTDYQWQSCIVTHTENSKIIKVKLLSSTLTFCETAPDEYVHLYD